MLVASSRSLYGSTDNGDTYVRLMNRLRRKLDGAPQHLPAPVETKAKSATSIGLIAYGSSHEAVREALRLNEESERRAG